MKTRLLLTATAAVLAGAAALFVGVAAWAANGQRLARLNVEETELSAEQSHNMTQLAKLLSVLQQLSRDPPPALLVSPRDAKDAVRAAILVKAMTPELQHRASGYATQAGEMMRQRRLAAVESEALFTDDSLRADNAPLPALRGPLSSVAPEEPTEPPKSLVMPAGGKVVRHFGESLSIGGKAIGITIAAASGGKVAAPGAGLVQYVGPVKGWGTILILRLAGGYHVVLAGLEQTSVAVGQSVAAGQAVGGMPDGRQSPPELYLEVREQGSTVDPARWLNTKAG